MKAVRSSETSGTSHPMNQHHIEGNLNSQHHCCNTNVTDLMVVTIFMYELSVMNVNVLQCYFNFLSIMRSDKGIKAKLVTLVVNSY
jgi:hypothetical protein